MNITVTKRSGEVVEFDSKRILNAIMGANSETEEMSKEDVNNATDKIVSFLLRTNPIYRNKISKDLNFHVERIQDVVELILMENKFYNTAKHYIEYRQKHSQRRRAQKDLINTYKDMLFADSTDVDLKRDNANINTDAPMGIMLKLGTESSKYFINNFVLNEEFEEADRTDHIHIHDKDFSLITLNCCQIDLLKLFHGGFSTGHGFLREPNSIRAYASLACIAIQSNQNDCYGGQSINAFDYAMAEGVRKSFKKAIINKIWESFRAYIVSSTEANKNKKAFCKVIKEAVGDDVYFDNLNGEKFNDEFFIEEEYQKAKNRKDCTFIAINKAISACLSMAYNEYILLEDSIDIKDEVIYDLAVDDVVEETHQAMEACIFNFNTLHSRAGAQVPFSSLNYGMDTSPEGQLVTEEVLNAIYAGLGNGETPIFPISVFQLKSGVNYNPEDPNYYLFKKACKVSAKRLFPKQHWGLLGCSYKIAV